MRHVPRGLAAILTAVTLIISVGGCQSTTHTSTRTYEYSDEPAREQPQEKSSEWEMVSPGEMVVDPDPGSSDDD